ncbi:RICIN domain-containing protein [Streptomyces sp. ICBB 8177]|uniref:RICIN domain-containing protein n=1 Tax=Streptomyces sp. ICBB 8177 TaxID=563922 RepID=UPI000D67D3DC|nr:RICIN domain-containing protein [Streptomyces sp. ICBB 8177]PWI41602.1 hypothetical protein CK485_22320 [Streptomyces sp. ICBB 8177]
MNLSRSLSAPPQRALARCLGPIAALLAVCCAVLGLVASPASAAARPAAGCGTALQCVGFTSASNGRQLDVQNGTMGDGAYIVTNSAPGYHQAWHLNVNPSDSSFTIVNNDTGKCIDVSFPALRQETCAGQASQEWYFQPVAGGTRTFMLRHEGDNTCLDLLLGAQYDDAWTDQYTCNGTVNQRWTLSSAAPASDASAAWNLAVAHAAAQCQQDTSTCTWAESSESAAAPLPQVCASAVWYNDTSGPISQAFAVNNTTGWSDTIASSVSSDLSGGAAGALQTKVSASLTFTNVWNGSTSVNNSVTVPVPAGQYGWVTLSELAKKVTGTWTFDARGFPWTAADTITVPLKDDPSGGATVYVAHTSPTFTSCV